MRTEQLEIFIITADAKSMHVASNLLHMSQQNISKAIKLLEEELNIVLFIRSNTGIALTKPGKTAYIYCKEIIHNVKALRKLGQNVIPSKSIPVISGNLELSLAPGFLAIAADLLRQIDASEHQITIYASEIEASAINKQLFDNSLHYEICFTAFDLNELEKHVSELLEKYQIYILSIEPLQFVASAHSTLGTAKSIPFSSLADIPLIFYKSTPKSTSLWLECLKRHGFRSTNVKEIGTPSLCGDYLNSNSAYTVATSFYMQHCANFADPPKLVLVPIKKSIPIAHALLIKKNCAPPAQYFEELFKDAYAQTYSLYDGTNITKP